MDPERFRRVEELYHLASQRDAAERSRFLREACGGDDDLQKEVESLFACEATAGEFMETRAPMEPEAKGAAPGTSMVGVTLSHYRIVEKLGSGGMGVVYRAHDERLNRDVAIKLLPPALLQDDKSRRRFRKEALALSKLSHPNVAIVYDFDTQDGLDFLVMELIPGITLNDRISQGPLLEEEVVRLARQMTEGLAAVHDCGVVHRDLKPGNLRLAMDGRLKILDFGLAKASPSENVAESLTDANALQGTLPYMAPELLLGASANERSDIYAGGAVLYEMATGRRPFGETQPSRLIYAIIHDPPAQPRLLNARISAGLNRIILKCLDKEPSNRYPSARELGSALERLAGDSSAPVPAIAAKRRAPWVIGAGALFLLTVFVITMKIVPFRDGAAPQDRISSLAVLPLDNLSQDSEQEYFADGMTDALITDLAQINALRVVSRTSVMPYKRTRKSLPQVAKELGVDAIVEGSVVRAGNRVRISAQLVRGSNDQHLWAEAYERDLRDVLLLQDEVARSIAQKIEVKLTPAEQQRLVRARTVDPEAYELYLKGRYFWVTRTQASIQKAIEMFNMAIARDPTYAAAYSGLADCYSSLGFSFDVGSAAPKDIQPKALAAVSKATELDDSLAEAHSSLAFIRLNYDWDWVQSEREFRRGMELNPGFSNSHHWYAHNLMSAGRQPEAEAESLRALQLDPLSPIMNAHLGWHYYFARQYDKSLEQLRKTIELVPNYGLAFWYSGWDYEQKGNYDDALRNMLRAKELLKGNIVVDADIGHLYAVSGKKMDAERVLGDLKKMASERYVNPFEIALIYVGLGEKERSFASLDQAYRERSDMLVYLNVDPRLDPIRSDPRFEDLVRKVGIPAR